MRVFRSIRVARAKPQTEMEDRSPVKSATMLAAICLLSIMLFPIVLQGCALHVLVQGCAMCYQSAAASGEQGKEALRHGILILIFPTLSLFAGIFGLLYRRRNISR